MLNLILSLFPIQGKSLIYLSVNEVYFKKILNKFYIHIEYNYFLSPLNKRGKSISRYIMRNILQNLLITRASLIIVFML